MPPSSGLPPGLRGDRHLLRISPRSAKTSERECPAQLAAKAHPALVAEKRVHKGKHPLETFPLRLVQERIDALEFHSSASDLGSVTGGPHPRLHPGLTRYVDQALHHYSPHLRDPADPELRPVPHYWVAQSSHERTWEMFTWGRRYESPDGTVREFRFLRMGSVEKAERSEAEIAIAAHTTAIGRPARWPPLEEWGQPFRFLDSHPSPGYIRRVRVIEIGLMDGSRNVLFDGAPEEAKARYEERGRHRHIEIVAGGAPRPGSSCVDCKALMACEERIWAPGLLGV